MRRGDLVRVKRKTLRQGWLDRDELGVIMLVERSGSVPGTFVDVMFESGVVRGCPAVWFEPA